jgi:hypothetical protein
MFVQGIFILVTLISGCSSYLPIEVYGKKPQAEFKLGLPVSVHSEKCFWKQLKAIKNLETEDEVDHFKSNAILGARASDFCILNLEELYELKQEAIEHQMKN